MGVRMNVLVVLAYSILIHPLIEIVQSVEENCYRGDEYEYDNPCANQPGQPQRLDYCPAGQRLAERCTERCEFCEPGSFSDSFNNCFTCTPCRTECPKGQVIIQQCSLEHDAVCGCPPVQCPTSPPSTCEPCPTVPPCPTIPPQTEKPETSSQPQVPLRFTQNCPSDIEEWADDDRSNKSVSWVEPQATSGSRTVHQTYEPGHYFPVGHFEVVYVFANNSGDTISCRFRITVKASVEPSGQPLCAPMDLMSIVIGVIVGIVVMIVILLVSCLCCYLIKPHCARSFCPDHQKNAKGEGNRECDVLLPNGGGDAHRPGNQENHQQAAGGLALAEGGCEDDVDEGTQLANMKKNDKENKNKKSPPNGPKRVELAAGGSSDKDNEESMTSSELVVNLPSENSETQLESSPDLLLANQARNDVQVPALKNPGVQVSEDDLNWLSDTVVNTPLFFAKNETFVRKMIGDHQKNLVKAQYSLDDTDPETKIFKYLNHGWRLKKSSPIQSALVNKLNSFHPLLARQYVLEVNKDAEQREENSHY